MDKKFLKAKDIAQLWGITPRRVNQLCTAGFINGAYKEGRYWLIPSDTTNRKSFETNKPHLCPADYSHVRLESLHIKKFPKNAIMSTKRFS